MRRFLILFLLIFFCLPVLAWNDTGAEASLKFLNHSVKSEVRVFKNTTNKDFLRIKAIKTNYKNNPSSIKNISVNHFASACIQRNENLITTYQNKYFVPAYEIYKKYDSAVSLWDWVHSVGLSEVSEFYDFYRLTEMNLENCQRILKLSE